MIHQLNRNEQDQLHAKYRENELFRQWSPLLSRQGWESQELDVVTLWNVAEGVIEGLRSATTERDEMIMFVFNRLVKDFRMLIDESGTSVVRTPEQAERSAVAVMCIVLTQLMNAVEKGQEDKDFDNMAMCVAIVGPLRSHPYFKLLMEAFFGRKRNNDGRKVVFTPSDPMKEGDRGENVRQAESQQSPFMAVVINKEKATDVLTLLHQYMKGKSKPKDIMRPVRAAIEAGVIRRPTFGEFRAEFGSIMDKRKTSFSNYTNTEMAHFIGDGQFEKMKDAFSALI